MPAPLLRRYSLATVPADTWTQLVPAVPANRALVGRLIVAAGPSGTGSWTFFVATSANAFQIASRVVLAAGETYEQNGIALVAGDNLSVFLVTTANTMHFSFFGQEVDNV